MLQKNKLVVVLVVLSFAGLLYPRDNYKLLLNTSTSLPQKAFWLKSIDKENIKTGQIIAFYAKNNRHYDPKKPFVKIVGGVSGDMVTEENRQFYINGKPIGYAKEFDFEGWKLEVGPTGIIPENKYFVLTPNKDSYDSRYADIGWIDSADIIGTAIPLF